MGTGVTRVSIHHKNSIFSSSPTCVTAAQVGSNLWLHALRNRAIDACQIRTQFFWHNSHSVHYAWRPSRRSTIWDGLIGQRAICSELHDVHAEIKHWSKCVLEILRHGQSPFSYSATDPPEGGAHKRVGQDKGLLFQCNRVSFWHIKFMKASMFFPGGLGWGMSPSWGHSDEAAMDSVLCVC